MDHGLVGPSVAYADLYQPIGRCGLCVLHEYVKIAVFVEYAAVDQLEFGIGPSARSVGVYQIQIRIFILRILIEILHIRMGRRTVQVVIIFLDVFAVIALAVGQAERPLLQDRILAVPQDQRKTQPLVIVTETGETILAPVIGA